MTRALSLAIVSLLLACGGGSDPGPADAGPTFTFEGWVEPAGGGWDGKSCPAGSTLEGAQGKGEASCQPTGPWARWHRDLVQKAEEGARDSGALSGEYRAWHPGGQPAALGKYAANLREGAWTSWNPSGLVASRGVYLRGARTGPWVFRYLNGQLEAQGSYDGVGREQGLWERFSVDGKPLERVTYAAGALEGPAERFFSSGGHREQGAYAAGLQEGAWTTWFENGQKESEGSYRRGLKEGAWRTWNLDGTLDSESSWTRGDAEGTFTRWYYGDGFPAYDRGAMVHSLAQGLWQAHTADGVHLLQEITYLDGLSEGPGHGAWVDGKKRFEGTFHLGYRCEAWAAWHANGQQDYLGRYRCNWTQNGQLGSQKDGPWTTWYPSGQKKSEGTWKDGVRVGDWTAWTEAGVATVSRFDEWGNQK